MQCASNIELDDFPIATLVLEEDCLLLRLPLFSFGQNLLILIIHGLLQFNVLHFHPYMVGFQLMLNLFILQGLVFEIKVHIGDVFGKYFFKFTHSCAPHSS